MVQNLIDLGLTSIILYLLIIFVLRLLGKKGLSQLSLADFVLVLLISKSLYNYDGLAGGIVMVLSLFAVSFILDRMLFKSIKFRMTVEGQPVILIDNGKVLPDVLKSERLTMDELIENVHENGLSKIAEVKWAILEVDGNISIIPKSK